jgi:hypothetical protein
MDGDMRDDFEEKMEGDMVEALDDEGDDLDDEDEDEDELLGKFGLHRVDEEEEPEL